MNFTEIKDLLSKNADPEKATEMAAYMRDIFAFFGIPKPKRAELTKQYIKKTNKICWNFVFDCFSANEREFQYVALDYLNNNKKLLNKADIPNIKKLAETKSWWDSIDCLDEIVGFIALNDESMNELLIDWSKDKNFWLRRIAIDHQLGRKEKTNTELLALIIKNNFNQDEFFINKAIGWALREYSKTNPNWVKQFIKDNEKNMAKLSIKEASKYL